MHNVRTKKISLEQQIAKLYIFLLPIRMIAPLTFLHNIIGSCAGSFDLIFHILGVIVYLLNTRGRVGYSKDDKSIGLLKYFIEMVLFFNISSLIMSIFMHARFGTIGGESAFEATFIVAVYYMQFALIMLYNKHVFTILTKEEILKILYVLVNCLLVLGYVQIAVLELGGAFRAFYERIDFLQIISAPNMPKLWLTGSEGAVAGVIMVVLIFPVLLSRICVHKMRLLDLLRLLLWLPIVYYTHSAMAWLMILLLFFGFCIIYIAEVKGQGYLKACLWGIVLLAVGIVVIFLVLNLLPQEISEEIRYLIFEKLTSREDGSTATRLAQFYISWGAFKEYPIFGIGNGNQGFFFEKYFPRWALGVDGTDAVKVFMRAQNQVANGASFILSIMSGYGLVGILLFVGFIVKALRNARNNKNEMGQFYFLMLIGWIGVLGSSLQCGFFGDYMVLFILSLPLISQNR